MTPLSQTIKVRGTPEPEKNSGLLKPYMARDFIDSINSCADSLPSVGEVILCIPRLLIFTGPRWIGTKLQHGNDSDALSMCNKLRYWSGATLKGLASIGGGALDYAQGFIDVPVHYLKNLAEFALRSVLACLSLVTWASYSSAAAYFIDLDDPAAVKTFETTQNELLRFASNVIVPRAIKNITSSTLPQEKRKEAYDLHELCMTAAHSNKKSRRQNEGHPSITGKAQGLSKRFRSAKAAQIPLSVLAKGRQIEGIQYANKLHKGPGKDLRLHINMENYAATILTGDTWSGLHVGVFQDTVTGKFVLAFPGHELGENTKTAISTTLGITDSALLDAAALVKAFVDEYGNDKVEVVAYSLGAALAQFAGCSNSVKVTTFNAKGLHVNQRNLLGSTIHDPEITHYNTEKDSLNRHFWPNKLLFPSSKIVNEKTRRYIVPGNFDHEGMKDALKGKKPDEDESGGEKNTQPTNSAAQKKSLTKKQRRERNALEEVGLLPRKQ
ncbi:hypothetical protein AAKU58_000533 [Oxalobacteraceae bacterium GrIS 1.18]